MKEKHPQTFYEEYEDEGIAEDGYLAYTVTRLRELGAPATEAARNANRRVATIAAIGGTACLFAAGATIGALRTRHA